MKVSVGDSFPALFLRHKARPLCDIRRITYEGLTALNTNKENFKSALEQGTFDFGRETILFTHTDLDGIGCAVLYKAKFGFHEETYFCNYNDVNERVNRVLDNIEDRYDDGDLPSIIITDISVDDHTAERLELYTMKGGIVLLLDHHKTAEALNRYDWAFVDVEASGTLLTYSFLNLPTRYRNFALLVDDYDRWIHDDPNSKKLNQLFFMLGFDRFIERFYHDPNVEFNAAERLLLELDDENKDRYIKRVEKGLSVYAGSNNERIGVGYADRYTSEAAHELINRLNLKAIALIDVNGGKVSLRSVGNYDVSTLAKVYGGGGHKNAAGVEYSSKTESHLLAALKRAIDEMTFQTFWKIFRGA